MPAHTVANPLPYKWRELLGKLRVTRRLSPLTDAFEEGQPVTFGQQPCGSEALGLQSADGASAGLILRIDEWGGWGSQQGTQTTACGPLDHDHPAAGRERTVDLLKHADAFHHLDKIDLSENLLETRGPDIYAKLPHAKVDDQRDAEYRYAALGE